MHTRHGRPRSCRTRCEELVSRRAWLAVQKKKGSVTENRRYEVESEAGKGRGSARATHFNGENSVAHTGRMSPINRVRRVLIFYRWKYTLLQPIEFRVFAPLGKN
jgi:hypothetical protein